MSDVCADEKRDEQKNLKLKKYPISEVLSLIFIEGILISWLVHINDMSMEMSLLWIIFLCLFVNTIYILFYILRARKIVNVGKLPRKNGWCYFQNDTVGLNVYISFQVERPLLTEILSSRGYHISYSCLPFLYGDGLSEIEHCEIGFRGEEPVLVFISEEKYAVVKIF